MCEKKILFIVQVYLKMVILVEHHQSCQNFNIFIDKRKFHFYTDDVRQKTEFFGVFTKERLCRDRAGKVFIQIKKLLFNGLKILGGMQLWQQQFFILVILQVQMRTMILNKSALPLVQKRL